MNIEQTKIKIQKLVNHYNSGNYLYVIREAGIILRKFPTSGFLMNLIGSCFQKIGEYEKAIKIFEDNIAINPKNIDAMNNLGNTLKLIDDYEKAEETYLKALNINPNFSLCLQNLANLKFELHDYESALMTYKKALIIDPKNVTILYNLGLVYQGLGKFNEAEKTLNEVLEINPNFTKAYKILSRIKKFNPKDKIIDQMEKKLLDNSTLESLKPDISFALGKAYEDIKDYERSFYHYEQGNKIINKIINYDFDNDKNLFVSLKENFKDIDFSKFKYTSFNDENFIFIIGLPRSGTSLTEQIISSHSNVFGGGELPYLENIFKKEFFKNKKIDQVKFNHIFNNDILDNIRKLYFKYSRKETINEKYLIDKNPMNFLWVGFIKLLFPNAKIINIKRNLKDNYLSLYKNMFDGNLNWTYDKNNLLQFCKNYIQLMEYWNKKIPNFILDVSYEELILDTKIITSKILDFCNLDWEDQCLEFYKNKRAIKTVSSVQARSPIYQDSIKSYDNYQTYLEEYFKELENL